MRVTPPTSRLTIADEGSRVSIEVPSKPNWFIRAFVGLWLCAWLAGELTVFGTFFTGHTLKPELLFGVVWLLMWTFGGLVAITLLAWNLAGREILSLGRDELSIRHDVRGIGFTRTYDAAHITRLRIDERPFNVFDARMSLAFWGLGGGRVAFDYGASTVRLGYGLDDPDASRILDACRRMLPRAS